MKKEKNSKANKVLTIVIIILFILLIGITCYFCYQKFNQSKEPAQMENKITVNEEEVNKLLETVPFDTNEKSKEHKDAYTEELVTIEDIDKRIYTSYALSQISDDQLLSYSKGMPVHEFYKNMKQEELKKQGKIYIKEQTVMDMLKKLYCKEDYTASNKETAVRNYEIYELLDNYYIKIATSSPDNITTKLSKLAEYNIIDGELIVKEKVGFLTSGLNGFYLTNSRSSKDYIYSCKGKHNTSTGKINTCEKTITKETIKEKYFEENLDKFYTYEHTFKKINGTYHWYSTKLAK